MALRPNNIITITQQPNQAVPERVLNTYTFDFVNSGEIHSSWQDLTDTAKIKFPRNIYIEDQNGNAVPLLLGTAIYNDNKNPLLLRGDKIKIELGCFSDFDVETGDYLNGAEKLYMPSEPQFTGYITKIKNRAPFEIECEDEMWQLKKKNVVNKVWNGSDYTVKQMLAEMLNGYKNNFLSPYQINDGGTSVSIGDFRTQNETVSMVLGRLRKDGGFYSYFRNNELRCAGITYFPDDILIQEVFGFQENIISDSLEYTRKEDLNIAIKAIAQNVTSTGGKFNYDGTEKSSKGRLEVMVGLKSGVLAELNVNDKFDGDLITFPVLSSNSITHDQILKRAMDYFPKFYYTGFRGSFNTFIFPSVKHGNAAIIKNKVIPEMEGTYLIKQVNTTFGMQGSKQNIMLHLRIDEGYTTEQLNNGL